MADSVMADRMDEVRDEARGNNDFVPEDEEEGHDCGVEIQKKLRARGY